MKQFGKIAMGALMLAGSAIGATVATTAPASAAHVSVGIAVGAPAPRPAYGLRDNPKCRDPHWAYENSKFCPSIYGPGGIPRQYGPNYYGYYDSGYYGPGYYEPAVGGFWFIDVSGHRRYHKGRFDGRGFHGRASWHRGGYHH
ncbi:MAG TPA: hypothetical protein VG867_09105 [Rhizomicrobium sp.]|nr:hypothetical protein [Rhizomicrobium sp.]